jgi:hypothetical protein
VCAKSRPRDAADAAQAVVEGDGREVAVGDRSPDGSVHQSVQVDHVVALREPGDLALERCAIADAVIHDDEGAPPHRSLSDAGDGRATEVMVPVLGGIEWVHRQAAGYHRGHVSGRFE